MLACKQVQLSINNGDRDQDIQKHLDACPACTLYASNLDTLKNALPQRQTVPAHLKEAINKQIEQSQSLSIGRIVKPAALIAAVLCIALVYYFNTAAPEQAIHSVTPVVKEKTTSISWDDLEQMQVRMQRIEERAHKPQHLLSKYQRGRHLRVTFKTQTPTLKPFKL